MARNVVTNTSPRCEHCRLPPRWCVCAAHECIPCELAVDVLMHVGEALKPTSTGHLIHRVVSGARQHVYDGQSPIDRQAVVQPDKELWILHPRGEPMPVGADRTKVQVLLIDGNWRQSVGMMKDLEGWGRKISLPMTGESRFWLRTQHEEGNFSTAEALLFVMEAMGLADTHRRFQLQFELHVYAGLRLRGNKALAERFLETSPLREAMPSMLERLCARRPNPRSF